MPIMDNDELVVKIIRICAIINAGLTPSENRALISLIQDFDKQRIRHSDFSKSIQLLFEKSRQVDEDGKTQQDVQGHIRQDRLRRGDPKIYRTESNRLAIRGKVDKSIEDLIRHDHLKIRVTNDERESEKYVTNVFNLEGKKRRILQSEPIERTLKKPRKSKRLNRVTPSYKLIPEEEQCPVSDPVLNNKCFLIKVDGASGHKKLTRYEEAMAICEDDMFETDMEIGALTSAVDSAEKVLRGEMRMEDLGVKFYRCIENLCPGDHKQTLPEILPKLKQKLNSLTVAREKLKSGWKQVFEENTAKQREFNAQVHRKKRQNNKFESDFRQP